MKILIYFTPFFFVSSLYSQIPLENQVNFGGSAPDAIGISPKTASPGYIISGNSFSPVSGDKTEPSRGDGDMWIISVDENFEIEFDKTIGGSLNDAYEAIAIDEDRMWLAASSKSPISGDKTVASNGLEDIWVVCLSSSGELLWQYSYGGNDIEGNTSILNVSDTSLLISATSYSGISGNKTVEQKGDGDVWILEISKADGHIIRQSTFGSELSDGNFSVIRNESTGNFIFSSITREQGISGDKTKPGFGGSDVWIVELNEDLQKVNETVLGGNFDDYAGQIVNWNDSYYILNTTYSNQTGNVTSPPFGTGADFWLVNLSTSLEINWDKRFGGNQSDVTGGIFRNGNGFVLSGISNSPAGSGNKTSIRHGFFDIWMVLTDDNGNIIAQETYGGSNEEYGSIVPGHASECLLSCSSESLISGNKTVGSNGMRDGWYGRINLSPYLQLSSESIETISAYPNPFKDHISFNFHGEEYRKVTFFTADGKEIDRIEGTGSTILYSPNQSTPAGIIFYTVESESELYKGKVVKID